LDFGFWVEETMEQFKVGDVVQLKSGGPKMTVSELESDNRVFCIWFSGNDRKSDTFIAQALKLYEKPRIS
jgi:uncharacterized protein YodC (DUF2158 family)